MLEQIEWSAAEQQLAAVGPERWEQTRVRNGSVRACVLCPREEDGSAASFSSGFNAHSTPCNELKGDMTSSPMFETSVLLLFSAAA